MDYQQELTAALAAVRAAATVCRAVQQRMAVARLQKSDKSPVTVADFAAQAVVCRHLQSAFPQDEVVAEEGSAALRSGAQAGFREQVAEAVRGVAPGASAEDALGWIERGAGEGRSARYWTLDPIDGTKGFLRGEQYAVALGLIVQNEVQAGVLGCPNYPGGGALFAAVRGGGARRYPLRVAGGAPVAVHCSAPRNAAEARFCESVESGHSNQSASAQIARRLGITAPPLRMDSQCKYAAVADGSADIYLRLPTRADYNEKIWDHAAGAIIVEEAGGRVSDVQGRKLDFRHGRTLAQNSGVVASCAALHEEVLQAVQAAG